VQNTFVSSSSASKPVDVAVHHQAQATNGVASAEQNQAHLLHQQQMQYQHQQQHFNDQSHHLQQQPQHHQQQPPQQFYANPTPLKAPVAVVPPVVQPPQAQQPQIQQQHPAVASAAQPSFLPPQQQQQQQQNPQHMNLQVIIFRSLFIITKQKIFSHGLKTMKKGY
jgi:hypothetical protein